MFYHSKSQLTVALVSLFNRELFTIRKYLAASANVRGRGADEVKIYLRSASNDVLGNAQEIAGCVSRLGGHLSACSPWIVAPGALGVKQDDWSVAEVLRSALHIEEEAIAKCESILSWSAFGPSVARPVLQHLLENSKRHREALRELLERFTADLVEAHY